MGFDINTRHSPCQTQKQVLSSARGLENWTRFDQVCSEELTQKFCSSQRLPNVMHENVIHSQESRSDQKIILEQRVLVQIHGNLMFLQGGKRFQKDVEHSILTGGISLSPLSASLRPRNEFSEFVKSSKLSLTAHYLESYSHVWESYCLPPSSCPTTSTPSPLPTSSCCSGSDLCAPADWNVTASV